MSLVARAFVLLAAGYFSFACGGESTGGGDARDARAASRSSASDFTARDLDGKTFRLSDHLGKEIILLDFWASWSKPSRASLPHLQALYDAKRSQGLLVVAVSMDGPETVATVPQVARSYDLTFPVVLDEDSSIASVYNPKTSTPMCVLVDRSGRIARVLEGYNPGDETVIEEDVAKLLSPSLQNLTK